VTLVQHRQQPLPEGTGAGRHYRGESYYGMPPLKPSPWDWTVSGYIFLAALSGSAQALAYVGQRIDRAAYGGVRRTARALATAGSAAGAVLLIIDLRTPQRWYNMLRIFRPTSPMSFGSYILTAFGGLSALTLLGELMGGRGRLGRAAEAMADKAQAGAAVTGAAASTYTAALLSATSTPYWAAAPRHLGVLFASSAVASGAAALSMGERLSGRAHTSRRLDSVAALATVVHVATAFDARRRLARAGMPEQLEQQSAGHILKVSEFVLAGALPLAAYALNRRRGGRSAGLSVAGSASLLAGAWLFRHSLLKIGMESAKDPQAQFRLAQPQARRRRAEPPKKPRRLH
jgi:protein NrfD